jgi:hypothetical protein
MNGATTNNKMVCKKAIHSSFIDLSLLIYLSHDSCLRRLGHGPSTISWGIFGTAPGLDCALDVLGSDMLIVAPIPTKSAWLSTGQIQGTKTKL